MATRGQTVGALWAAMGLDLSSLDSDFALADKTIKDAMIRLNTEKRAVVIKAETDINGLDEAKDKVKILRIQEQSLTEQIDIQRQKVAIADAVYKQMVATKGADAVASQSLRMRLLNERKAYSELESQIRKTQKAQNGGMTSKSTMGDLLSNITMGQAAIQGGMSGALSSIGMVKGKLALGLGAIAGGFGLMELTKGAMTAGNNIYTLAQKMHTSNAEAAQMSMIFRLAGADANDAVPAIVRLDKSVQSAGTAGNDTTRMLQVFGVNLRDTQGNLLPVNHQLSVLAKGYRNAAAAGMENEYVSQVLGSRGAALVPVLEQMNELQEQAANIRTTGLLNPDESHKLSLEWNTMKIEAGQLGNAVGSSLVPVANELMPQLIDVTKDFISEIQNHKEDIKSLASGIMEVGDAAIKVAGHIADMTSGIDSLLEKAGAPSTQERRNKTAFSAEFVGKIFSDIKAQWGGTQEEIKAAQAQFSADWDRYNSSDSFTSWKQSKKQAADDKLEANQRDRARRAELDAIEKSEQEKKAKEMQANLKAIENAKKIAAANKEIQEEIYNATHSELERELHAIDLKSMKYKEEGGDEVSITEMAEAEKAKIIQDFNDNTMAQIRKVWKSELQNRLDDIDREKRAWIQKGVDEVTASRWAEHEKAKARQDEALSMFRDNREYLNIMRNAMAGGGDRQQMMNNARMAMLEHMREKMGIQNDFTTPDEVSMFSELMNEVKRNLVPGLEEDQWARNYRSSGVEIIRGNKVGYEFTNMTISVNYPRVEGGGNIEVIKGVTAAIENGVNRAKQMSDYGYSNG